MALPEPSLITFPLNFIFRTPIVGLSATAKDVAPVVPSNVMLLRGWKPDPSVSDPELVVPMSRTQQNEACAGKIKVVVRIAHLPCLPIAAGGVNRHIPAEVSILSLRPFGSLVPWGRHAV